MSQHAPGLNPHNDPAPAFPAGTLVFGLILLAVGIALLAGLLLNFTFSTPLLFIGLIGGAGAILIIAGIIAARRAR
ncbi:MAG: hypothetical protein Q4P23_00840 [Micrococcaceae bacterium]|nr:hypothetical protein [Micrococcaceae bacterium]